MSDILIRKLLSSWKQGREFRAAASHHHRKKLVPHASQTDLNREFANSGQDSAGWLFIALMVLAAIDYFFLRTGLA
ncbi:hypothetical protein [Bradyrhizobium sp. JYMT SZCCT0428]|uniref:hypothetical protein n=1 Tax=Bradyrhizobium sp. JYMT SZCCT0428 TaxID=2807673 RepID=UPI001BA8EB3E|nr:hypothetical protein [Bradyrhizobium sp. JYMT SZCCT0428]MBR1157173.1 hypothetical protein [Bradyrhizobium sp. JYMT SZCCT0428]